MCEVPAERALGKALAYIVPARQIGRMAKTASQFVCQSCGAVSSKWAGRCDNCGEWNTIVEESAAAPVSGAKGASLPKGRVTRLVGLRGDTAAPARIETGIAELDRVAGGGFVPGSGVLVGGDPGIGKSTLLLQAMAALARKGRRVIYVSGEEAIAQVRLRAERLGIADTAVLLATETNVSDIVATLNEGDPPAIAVIDSIQTLWSPVIEAAPGTVSQLKAGSEALIRFAKQKGTTILLVGHVTKDGQIAGPKVIEHMVDTVLYFEGDRGHQFRILRAVKNRFGPTDEIGVFEMSDGGLREVANPSRLFMGSGEHADPGFSRVCRNGRHAAPAHRGAGAGFALRLSGTRGARPSAGIPTAWRWCWRCLRPAPACRSAITTSISMSRADSRCGKQPPISLSPPPLLSSLTGTIVPHGTRCFGEIALSGAIRPVGPTEARLKEAHKLGLREAVIAARPELSWPKGFKIKAMETISDLVAWAASQAERPRHESPSPCHKTAYKIADIHALNRRTG